MAGEEFDGKPRIIIFYLGFGCLHCVEQIHKFSPLYEEYKKAGIEVIGISTETVEQLQEGLKTFGEDVNIPLFSDGDKNIFKEFRCWDDFENQPLHGTFLIDKRGKVRWQDISYEPFNDADFLLKESKRLLALP
ncbi:peroxiredoxin family protein [bacterium]|nr:peroxiredoxin family protein [bacterium]